MPFASLRLFAWRQAIYLAMEFLVVACMTGNAWSQENQERIFVMKEPSQQNGDASADATPSYPYPPEDLWRRLMQVVNTPPGEITINRIEKIFGIEFDDTKLLLWGDEEEKRQKKYFSSSKKALKDGQKFPFHTLHTTQFPERSGTGTRVLTFHFNVFDPGLSREILWKTHMQYCIKPDTTMLEALEYRYKPEPFNPHSQSQYRSDLYAKYRGDIRLTFIDEQCIISFDYDIAY